MDSATTDLLIQIQGLNVASGRQLAIRATRQWGKSTCTAGETVHDSLIDPGTKWVTMSAGERQSLEWLGKAKEWQAAYQMVIADVIEDRGGIAEGLVRSSEIIFNTGSPIIACISLVPTSPTSASPKWVDRPTSRLS